MKHPIYFTVGSVVLGATAWLAWAILRDNQLERGFEEVAAGATEREVSQKLGRPKRVEKCGEFFGPLTKEELEKCSKEYFLRFTFCATAAGIFRF